MSSSLPRPAAKPATRSSPFATSERWRAVRPGAGRPVRRKTPTFDALGNKAIGPGAVFKLIEINERQRLLRNGAVVIDLGAAPGGWSQYAADIVGEKGRVIAVDVLPIEPLRHVTIVTADFSTDDGLNAINAALQGAAVGLVMSDMAPNISGIKSVDQSRAMHLAELALAFARGSLAGGGGFVAKLFHGEGFDDYVRDVRRDFSRVSVRKPAASRPASRETYLVAQGYRV